MDPDCIFMKWRINRLSNHNIKKWSYGKVDSLLIALLIATLGACVQLAVFIICHIRISPFQPENIGQGDINLANVQKKRLRGGSG